VTENNNTQQTAPAETRAESPAENSVEITEALRAEYAELTDKIRAARRAYYNEDAPFLSDAEYDALYRRLEIIEAEHPLIIANDSPTQEDRAQRNTDRVDGRHLDLRAHVGAEGRPAADCALMNGDTSGRGKQTHAPQPDRAPLL